MSIEPKKKMTRRLGYFEDSGIDRKKYALLIAAYRDDTETAKALIKSDPEQINRQDPHSGLTALHISIFRQNRELVGILAKHPQTKMDVKDNFNRRLVDMLDYTSDQEIFEVVMEASYPDIWAELDALAGDENKDESAKNSGSENETIVPFKPKGPS